MMWPLVPAFVRRRSGVFEGHFLVGLSGPFSGADLPCAWAPHGGAVKGGLALGEATASRREASCVLGMPSVLGGESPLCNLMEVKHE
jgi:hypothetical protein